MEEGPSREELLGMLTGEGYTGGAKKKKRNPWLSFLKKHPGLSMEEASRKYKKKGSGLDGDMEGAGDGEEDGEYYFEGGKIKRRRKKSARRKKGRGIEEYMTGGADPSSIPSDKEAWRTKNVRLTSRYIKVGKLAWEAMKTAFPKEYERARKKQTAAGGGITFQDYVRFVKSKPENSALSGNALRNAWDANVKADHLTYLSPSEAIYFAIGEAIQKLVFAKENVKEIELGETAF